MAELAALANIAAVAGASFKIAEVLIDIGRTLGSAGKDIRALGDQIASDHQILEAMQYTLLIARPFRIHPRALKAAQNTLDNFDKKLTRLKSILDGLPTHKSSKNLARIRWTLKKNQVKLLQEDMHQDGAKLQLFLTMMTFENTLMNTGPTTNSGCTMAVDLRMREVAGQAYIAQQLAEFRKNNVSGCSFSRQEICDTEWNSATTTCISTQRQTTSLPGTNFVAKSPMEMGPTQHYKGRNISQSPMLNDRPNWPLPQHDLVSTSRPTYSSVLPAVRVIAQPTRGYYRLDNVIDADFADAVIGKNTELEVAKMQELASGQCNGWYNLFESKEDSCQKMIGAALKSLGLGNNWWQWRVYIVCEGQERYVDHLESPLRILAEMGFGNKRANLVLQHMNDERSEECKSF